jgi:hypothetical protein
MKGAAMNIKVARADLLLQDREVLRLRDAMGARVQCLRGALWVTQHRDPEDHFIGPGDALTLDRPGLALIHAIAPAEVILSETAPEPDRLPLPLRALRAALRASARWIARRFGPAAIDDHRWRGWYGAL